MHNLVQISHDATRRFIVHSSLKLHSWKLAIFYLESQSIITANASLSRKDVDIPSFEKFLKSGLVFIAISDAGDHVVPKLPFCLLACLAVLLVNGSIDSGS